MLLLLTMMAAAPLPLEPFDFAGLDAAIERCDRKLVLPVFAAEAQKRSTFITTAYQEQAAINAERLATAEKRRALREAVVKAAAPSPPKDAAAPAESDQELALRQLALDDRQRALDDARRLESMRQDAVDMKRAYFLVHCPSGKKAD